MLNNALQVFHNNNKYIYSWKLLSFHWKSLNFEVVISELLALEEMGMRYRSHFNTIDFKDPHSISPEMIFNFLHRHPLKFKGNSTGVQKYPGPSSTSQKRRQTWEKTTSKTDRGIFIPHIVLHKFCTPKIFMIEHINKVVIIAWLLGHAIL